MKLTINTTSKTISVEGTVPLNELMESLETLFPNGAWKEYKLEQETVYTNTSSPVYIPYYPYPTYPINTPYRSPFWYGTTGDTITGDLLKINTGNALTVTGDQNVKISGTTSVDFNSIFNQPAATSFTN